jgi:hypothetical protein
MNRTNARRVETKPLGVAPRVHLRLVWNRPPRRPRLAARLRALLHSGRVAELTLLTATLGLVGLLAAGVHHAVSAPGLVQSP